MESIHLAFKKLSFGLYTNVCLYSKTLRELKLKTKTFEDDNTSRVVCRPINFERDFCFCYLLIPITHRRTMNEMNDLSIQLFDNYFESFYGVLSYSLGSVLQLTLLLFWHASNFNSILVIRLNRTKTRCAFQFDY